MSEALDRLLALLDEVCGYPPRPDDEDWYAAREASERREAAKAWGDDPS